MKYSVKCAPLRTKNSGISAEIPQKRKKPSRSCTANPLREPESVPFCRELLKIKRINTVVTIGNKMRISLDFLIVLPFPPVLTFPKHSHRRQESFLPEELFQKRKGRWNFSPSAHLYFLPFIQLQEQHRSLALRLDKCGRPFRLLPPWKWGSEAEGGEALQ